MCDRWTEDEIAFIRENWGKMTPENIAKKLSRSVNAINVKSKRIKLGPIMDVSKFTKREICLLLGGMNHRTVNKWVKEGYLTASYAKTTSDLKRRKNILQVTPTALKRFLEKYPELWDARRIGDIKKAISEKEFISEKVKLRRAGELKKREIPKEIKPAFAFFVVEVIENYKSKSVCQAAAWKDFIETKILQDNKRFGGTRALYRWTKKEDNRLRELFKDGRTYKEIGDDLGRTVAAVGHRLKKIDIWGVS